MCGSEGAKERELKRGRWQLRWAHTSMAATVVKHPLPLLAPTAGPAQRHDPLHCPICSWAAVPPYDKAGSSPSKAGGRKSPLGPKAPAAGKKRAAAATAAASKRSKKATSHD